MKKVMVLVIALAMVLSLLSTVSFAEDLNYVKAYVGEGTIGVWLGHANGATHLMETSVQFNAAASFKAFKLPVYWSSNPQLNDPAVDYTFTITPLGSATPAYSVSKTSSEDSPSGIVYEFDEIPAGEYEAKFTITSSEGYFVLPSVTPSNSNVRLKFSDSAFGFEIGFTKSDLSSYFMKLSSMADQEEIITATLAPKGTEPHQVAEKIGIKITVPAGRELISVTGVNSPTWNNQNPPNTAKCTAYVWTGDYDTTVAGTGFASASVDSHQDNQDIVLTFDKRLTPGTYILLFDSLNPNDGPVGFWFGSESSTIEETYIGGQQQRIYPGMSANFVVTDPTIPAVPTADASMIIFIVAAAAIALVVLKKKVF